MDEKIHSMSDEDFVAAVGEVYNQINLIRNSSDYVVNQPQMDKFDELLAFFVKKAGEFGDEIQEISLNPVDECGGITARFLVFNVNGAENVQEFCKVISYCSAFGIDSVLPEGVCISCTVPNVFVKK